MVERVTRYLLGTLVDFDLLAGNRFGHRQIRPLFILPETVVFLAYELHFAGGDDTGVVRSPDWGLFGLPQADVISALEKAATHDHLFLQHSGAVLRIEWKHPTMEAMLDALAH